MARENRESRKMCQSKEQGGHRCAAHLRQPYQSAINNVFRYGRKLRDIENLLDIATEYALTGEGIIKIKKDIEKNPNYFDITTTLGKALAKAKIIKEADAEAESLIRKASGLPELKETFKHDSNGIAPEPISWSASEPIWPNRETTSNATKGFHGTLSELEYVKKAYRSIFKDEWKKMFYLNGSLEKSPSDNREGWEWRKSATSLANKKILGAKIIGVQEASPGAHVFNGKEVRQIKKVKIVDETVDFAKAMSYEKCKAVHFKYTGSEKFEQPDYSVLVLLPNFI